MERAMIEKRKRRAAEIAPELVRLVEREASWPAAAKAALIQALPACTAKWLNKWGVDAEYAPEVAIAGAAVAIAGHSALVDAELTRQAKALAQRREDEQSKATPVDPMGG
jgi:hypothetical protein